MTYLTRIHHFRFDKDGDQIVITSEREPGFEEVYVWPEEWFVGDKNLTEKLHDKFYADALEQYDDFIE